MKEVEYLDELKEGEMVYLIKKDGKKEILLKLESIEPELKGVYVKSQYPNSGNLEYLSNKDWNEKYLRKFIVSGESFWGKEYKEK
ncbi:MAG: hypothetical protein MUO82_00485 [Candidatus Thermoplasmatota archaeon]|nr:hypothetical protein [Candidatus Thermoplasmatota archaeon]